MVNQNSLDSTWMCSVSAYTLYKCGAKSFLNSLFLPIIFGQSCLATSFSHLSSNVESHTLLALIWGWQENVLTVLTTVFQGEQLLKNWWHQMTLYMNLNLHTRAFSAVSALSGGTATQCMESAAIIGSPRLDMKHNKSTLSVQICL